MEDRCYSADNAMTAMVMAMLMTFMIMVMVTMPVFAMRVAVIARFMAVLNAVGMFVLVFMAINSSHG
jgi:cytosine/uracil/thiamine/allantoin permease